MADMRPEPVSNNAAKRASDRDREQVVDRLRDAASEGRIDLAEFEERMGAAYTARTYGELERLTTDLPDAATAAAPPQQDLVLRAHGSSVRRDGRWPVPRRLVVHAEHGSVRLDLTRAVVLAAEVEVEVDARHSSVLLLVPEGTHTVDDGLDAHWSSAKLGHDDGHDDGGGGDTYEGRGGALAHRPRFRIRLTGEVHHSSVTVRPPNVADLWRRRVRAWWRRLLRPA